MEMGRRWIMKRNRVFQAIIMVFSSLLIVACAALASDEEKIQNRIETFAQAANEGDWDEMINMFDSNTREKVEAVVAFGNGMLGELSDVDLSFQDLYAFGTTLIPEKMIDVTLDDIKIEDNYATVRTMAEIQEQQARGVIFSLVKEGDDWFIYDIQDE